MGISFNAFGKAEEKVLALEQHATIQARGRCLMNIRACPAKTPHLFHVLKALQESCRVQIGLGFSPAVNRVLADHIEVAMGTVPTSHWPATR